MLLREVKDIKALIAMSGGVDSSVAAKLVSDMGYECIGCTMKLYNNLAADNLCERTCCSLDDVEDARSVAAKLGMPYYVFNFIDSFKKTVIDKFIHSYESGVTPNPCIDCNRYMKFDALYRKARILGCDYIVTGHYAQIEYDGKQYYLKKAIDETKDQSYVLYSMTQSQLAQTMLPLGNMLKSEARKVAKCNGFQNSGKLDSQDICFVPDGDYASMIERLTGRKSRDGYFVDMEGHILGKHKGIINYTIGQRKGLGLSSIRPMYVCKLSPETNTIVLGYENDLYSRKAIVSEFHWISEKVPERSFRCKAKIRYRQKEQWATVMPINDDSTQILFDEPQRAITAGQAAVLYDGDIVLGGGVIV